MARAELLSIGAELLLGETVDTNAAYLGGELARVGLPLAGARMLPDDRSVIADAFREAHRRSALVIATGGLGPTHDDLTREGLADALGESLHEDRQLLATLEERFGTYGPMPASNRRQALLIPSAQPLVNPIGSAPGWWVPRDAGVTVLMPGVPSEMRRMWSEQVAPRLVDRFGRPKRAVRTIKAFGLGESALAERLGTLITEPPAGVDVGIYARDDGIHVRFSAADDPRVLAPLADQAREILGDHVFGTDADDLAGAALARLGRLGAREVASWEADTQGALLSVLAAAEARDGAARFIGGVLEVGSSAPAPVADAVIQLSLLPQDAGGRSRCRVAVSGVVSMPQVELRIHGSGPQRLRRAAYAALDAVRRLSPSDR